MFKNIGRKIKGVAKIACWIGILFSVIEGIIILGMSSDFLFNSFFAGLPRELKNQLVSLYNRNGDVFVFMVAVLVVALGVMLSWIGSFTAYGFGELVENSCIQTKLMVKKEMEKEEPTDK